MNRRMVFNIIGYIAMAEALLMLLPALVALIYLEPGGWSFVISAAVCAQGC